MQQPHRGVPDVREHRGARRVVSRRLRRLDVPVAELVPEEAPQRLGRVAEVERVQEAARARTIVSRRRVRIQRSAGRHRRGGRQRHRRRQPFGQREHVARRVPDLVVEVARLFAARLLIAHLLALEAHLAQHPRAGTASAPYFSTRSIGSMTLPSDFDILRPCASKTSGVMKTSRNGTSSMKCRPSITMRATHRKMISPPVISTCDGYQQSSSGVRSGQPRIENGHKPLENQVSSVSGSRVRLARAVLALRDLARLVFAFGDDFAAVGRVPDRQADAPTRSDATRSSRGCSRATARTCGRSARARSARVRRDRPPARAARAARLVTNHCSESSGSTTSPLRSLVGTAWRCGSAATSSPVARRSATMRSRASKRSRPAYGPDADVGAGDARVEADDRRHRQPWRTPIS